MNIGHLVQSPTHTIYISEERVYGYHFTISSVKSEQDAKEKGLPQHLPQYLQPRFQKSVRNHGCHDLSGRDFSV